MVKHLPSIDKAKAQANRLRQDLAAKGEDISHSSALERVAVQHGFQDWNTFYAAMGNRSAPRYTLGGRVSGKYLGQPFRGTIHAAAQSRPGWVQLVLDLDEAVDVVSFESFSNYRSRIRGQVGPDGHSREKTSDGTPHLVVDL
ncbi:MAG: glyoxalase superfamily protein [Paracoccaceae bacterium]|jgi:hypothetical protein|nr:glyoxalase superfamily protein [Paracoccaceae bacterium]MDP7184254.1 glyoxalase superfamily protein [Paracoccaceae bacterium]